MNRGFYLVDGPHDFMPGSGHFNKQVSGNLDNAIGIKD